MATRKKTRQSSKAAAKSLLGRKVAAAIAIIIIIIAIIGAAYYGLSQTAPGGSGSFQRFKDTFNSAPRVFIYAEYVNATTFGYTETCAVNMVEQIIGSPSSHRNASTISFAQIDTATDKCALSILGSSANATTNMTSLQCVAAGVGAPSIFINYSYSNHTDVIGSNLYVSGDAGFLTQCGISAQISS